MIFNNRKTKYILTLEKLKRDKSLLFNVNLWEYHNNIKFKDYDDELNYYNNVFDILLNYDDNNNTKFKLYKLYCKILHIDINENNNKKKLNINKCSNCNINININLNICNHCGFIIKNIEYNNDVNFNDDYINNKTKYKKCNHLQEFIKNINYEIIINDEIIERIKNEYKKHNINKDKININNLKIMIKKCNLTLYNENIIYIYYKLTDIKENILTIEQIDKIKDMFKKVEKSFYKLYNNRKNLISYEFILYKIFYLLGLNQYLKYFKIIKDKKLNNNLNDIWLNICKDLNIVYHYH